MRNAFAEMRRAALVGYSSVQPEKSSGCQVGVSLFAARKKHRRQTMMKKLRVNGLYGGKQIAQQRGRVENYRAESASLFSRRKRRNMPLGKRN